MKNGCVVTWYDDAGTVIKTKHYFDISKIFKKIQENNDSGVKEKFTVYEVGECLLDFS